MLVCSLWKIVIKQAPWEKLPKYIYREVTVTNKNGFEVKLERNVYSDNRPALGEEGSKKWQKLKKSIRSEQADVGKYMKNISCKKLIFQSLSGNDFTKMLHDFSYLCLDAKILAFDFCDFASIQLDIMVRFLKARHNFLMEVSLSSCRNLENCLSPEEFLESIGNLNGPLMTYRLKDHYPQSPWKDRLAEMILDTRPFWMLDMDGITPSMITVENRLKRWLRPLEAVEETGCLPLDVSLLNPVNVKRKPVILKFENNRSTRLFSFWKKVVEIMPFPTSSFPAGNSGFGPAIQDPNPPLPPLGRVYWSKPPKSVRFWKPVLMVKGGTALIGAE